MVLLLGGSLYLLSVYRLHGIILTSIILSYRRIRCPMVVCGCHREVFCRTRVIDSSPHVPEVYIMIYLGRTSGISHPTSQQEEQSKRSEDELQSVCG
jgi:hypothetical protein